MMVQVVFCFVFHNVLMKIDKVMPFLISTYETSLFHWNEPNPFKIMENLYFLYYIGRIGCTKRRAKACKEKEEKDGVEEEPEKMKRKWEDVEHNSFKKRKIWGKRMFCLYFTWCYNLLTSNKRDCRRNQKEKENSKIPLWICNKSQKWALRV